MFNMFLKMMIKTLMILHRFENYCQSPYVFVCFARLWSNTTCVCICFGDVDQNPYVLICFLNIVVNNIMFSYDFRILCSQTLFVLHDFGKFMITTLMFFGCLNIMVNNLMLLKVLWRSWSTSLCCFLFNIWFCIWVCR